MCLESLVNISSKYLPSCEAFASRIFDLLFLCLSVKTELPPTSLFKMLMFLNRIKIVFKHAQFCNWFVVCLLHGNCYIVQIML